MGFTNYLLPMGNRKYHKELQVKCCLRSQESHPSSGPSPASTSLSSTLPVAHPRRKPVACLPLMIKKHNFGLSVTSLSLPKPSHSSMSLPPCCPVSPRAFPFSLVSPLSLPAPSLSFLFHARCTSSYVEKRKFPLYWFSS